MDFEVMLAKTYKPERIKDWGRITVEPKLDGVRVVSLVRNGDVEFFSRNCRKLQMFDHLAAEVFLVARYLSKNHGFSRDVMFDGEMLDSTFGEIAGAIHRKNATVDTARFHIFHAMPLANLKAGLDTVAQSVRMVQLEETEVAFAEDDLPGLTFACPLPANTDLMVRNMNKTYRKKGHEGSMVKDLSRPWEAKRSYGWMKIKDELSVDVRVTGMREGTGKYRGMCGALVCDYKGQEIRVSGMDDDQRTVFWNRPKTVVGHTVEVVYQQETVHGLLRHPRFKRMRPDKE